MRLSNVETTPFLQKNDDKSSHTFYMKTVLFLFIFSLSIVFSHYALETTEVPVGTKRRLWDLLSKIKIRDAKGVKRTWSEFECLSGAATRTIYPMCNGKLHSCELASQYFHRFRESYQPQQTQPAQTPIEFPYEVYHLDNKFVNVHDKVEGWMQTVIARMLNAQRRKHHLMWLIEVKPEHAFIIEQVGDPFEFRLYHSWSHGFDINYWIENGKPLCYKNNWGKFDEFKYDQETSRREAKENDVKHLQYAKHIHGGHATFDNEIFGEIVTKLCMGWQLTKFNRMAILQGMKKKEASRLDVIAKQRLWSLKHIFGLEPIRLQAMEKAPFDYSITIQVLNLGTKDEFELIEPKKVEEYEPIIEDITDQKEQMSDTNGGITDPRQMKLDDI